MRISRCVKAADLRSNIYSQSGNPIDLYPVQPGAQQNGLSSSIPTTQLSSLEGSTGFTFARQFRGGHPVSDTVIGGE